MKLSNGEGFYSFSYSPAFTRRIEVPIACVAALTGTDRRRDDGGRVSGVT